MVGADRGPDKTLNLKVQRTHLRTASSETFPAGKKTENGVSPGQPFVRLELPLVSFGVTQTYLVQPEESSFQQGLAVID
jgi:hypothetical protein